MRFNGKPVLRKLIIPWYDSDSACGMVLAFMTGVLGFAISGIYVATNTQEYRPHLWVPSLLAALSFYVIVSAVTRMIKRR